MKTILKFGLFYILCAIFCSGCLSVKNIPQNNYLFNVNAPAKTHYIHVNKTLEINNTVIAPQFTGQSFIYRLNDISYTADYYNIFLTPPTRQINQILINYMRDKGMFSYVGHNIDSVPVTYQLNPEILQLYADYRNTNYPKAVFAMHFTLVQGNKVILNKTYQQVIPLMRKDSVSLVYAWDKGLSQILNQLSRDIAAKI
jgi:ABC-type uncharacterized transport system auxiliary subunit